MAAWPRLYGLSCGLPDEADPRERYVLAAVRSLAVEQQPPEIFNWPGTPWLHSLAAAYLVVDHIDLWSTLGGEPDGFILVMRLANVGLGVLAVGLTCLAGRRWLGPAGDLAGAMLAVAMLHATNESRFALTDVPASAALAAVLLTWPQSGPQPAAHRWWLPGILAGFAVSVKYAAAVLPAVMLLAAATGRDSPRWRSVVVMLVASLLGFTIGCPYWLLDAVSSEWNHLIEDFWYERSHYRLGHYGLIPTGDQTAWTRLLALWPLLSWGVGWPMAAAWVAALTAPGARRLLPVWLIAVASLVLLALTPIKFPRHLIVAYPAMSLLAAAVWVDLAARWPRGASLLAVGLLLAGAFHTAAFARVYRQPPTPEQAGRWLAEREATASLGPNLPMRWLAPRQHVTSGPDWRSAEFLLVAKPVLRLYDDVARRPAAYRASDWFPIVDHRPEQMSEFVAEVRRDWRPVASFAAPPGLGRWRVDLDRAPPPFGRLRHPELVVYQRAAP